MDKFAAHTQNLFSASTEWDRNQLGWLEDEWDEDHLAGIEYGELGYAREDLRLAENLYSPELPDDILLRLYNFVMSHGDDEPGIWSVLRAKTKSLMLSRLRGGPQERDAKYSRGFDPKDHALAIEALSNNAIPYPELLTLYEVVSTNKGLDDEWNSDAVFASDWSVVFDLLREKILAIMAVHRADIQGAFDQSSTGLSDAARPGTGSGDVS